MRVQNNGMNASLFKRLMSDVGGVSAIEYVVIICFTAAMPLIAWQYMGGNLSDTFESVSCYVTGSSGCSGADDDGDGSVDVAESDEDDGDDDEIESASNGDDEDDSDDDDDDDHHFS